MISEFDRNQIRWAIQMNFKDWDLFKTCFVGRYLISMYKDWRRGK